MARAAAGVGTRMRRRSNAVELSPRAASNTSLDPQVYRPRRLDAPQVVRPLGEKVGREALLHDRVRCRAGQPGEAPPAQR